MLKCRSVFTALNGNLYRCVVTDITGPSTSNGALLTVNAVPAVSSVTRAATVCEGAAGATTSCSYSRYNGASGATWLI